MTQPSMELDLTKVLEYITIVGGIVAGWWKYIDNKFKQDKLDKQQFIKDVVNATMESCLGDLKSDLHEFKNKTEAQMNKFNDTVLQIYAEVKK